MNKVIEFPKNPSLVGHVVVLNLAKARRFQCGGFFVSAATPVMVVDEGATQEPIQRAIAAGVLTDATEHPELWQKPDDPGAFTSEDTGQKVYSGKRQFFEELGFGEAGGVAEEIVYYATSDPAEQTSIEEALAKLPAAPSQAPARPKTSSLLALPPGMSEPEKYLIKV